jgi:hypothetical protein
MSEITFPSNQSCLFDRDVIEFPAIVDGKIIKCRITLEELIREWPCGASPKTFERHFLTLRPQIEERAKQQILAKGAERQ